MPAMWIAAAGTLLGGAAAFKGSSKSGDQTVTNKQEMDPRTAEMLFGSGRRLKPGVTPTYSTDENGMQGMPNNPDSDYETSAGLLSQYQGMLGTPQNAGINHYGQHNDAYLNSNAIEDMGTIAGSANNQIQGELTAPTMQGAQVNAPAQNKMDLTGSYDKFINGAPGGNPFLTGAIQKGINQSSNAFGNMVSDAKNATNDVLGSIRGNSVLAGQYGGSRQGLAEGKAIESMNTQLGRAASQFGQNNTDAAVSAQAGAYDADSNRALSATQGLGAQQYGVASQDAAARQSADQTNINALMNTRGLNAATRQNGISNLNGLLSGAYNVSQNQDSYALNQAGKVNGLLAPYLGQVPGSSTSSQPLYSNTMGNMIGGATMGGTLGKQIGGWFNGGGGTPSTWQDTQNGWNSGSGY